MRSSARSHILVHYHIFKNAGSSVDAMLRASFGAGWREFEGGNATDVKGTGELKRFLGEHRGLRAVSTHLGRPPLPDADRLPIVFLRHPMLRARSVYEYVRQNPGQPNHARAVAEGFPGYVRWALRSDDGGVVLRDYQVIHLSTATFRSGSVLRAKATAADLAEVCHLLAAWGIVGIVERFERSAALFRRVYARKVPDFAFSPVWENRTSSGSKRSQQEGLDEVHETLGPHLHGALLDHNRLDLALYEFGCRLSLAVETALALIDDRAGPAEADG